MAKFIRLFTLFILLFFTLSSCDAQVKTTSEASFQVTNPDEFNAYWYSGKAELNHFDLTQVRYGEKRPSDAVLIYVTEDFLTDKQVKKEFGDDKSVSVLKLNFVKKFTTGIYDYSIMTSVFTPLDFRKHPATLKLTFSSQEWCGQSFAQMNMQNGKLHYQERSYFQAEGDLDKTLDATYVEEDVWTRIRIEPQMLPLGKITMVPSQELMRLNHIALKAYEAEASLVLQVNDQKSGGQELYIYTLRYPELDRTLKITCQSAFPYKILGWEETMNASNPAKALTTKAVARKTMNLPYWELNKNEHEVYRDSLGLNYGVRGE